MLLKNSNSSIAALSLRRGWGEVQPGIAFGFDGLKYAVRQVNSYYPYGMNIKELSANNSSTVHRNEYLYNGKMFQDEMGLGWLDYGARFYDPVLGRWHAQDRFSEAIYNSSQYVYVGDDLIAFFDPDGNFRIKFIAQMYAFIHGGHVEKSKKNGEFYVWKEVGYKKGVTFGPNIKLSFNWSGEDTDAYPKPSKFDDPSAPNAKDLLQGGSGMPQFCPECPSPMAGPSMGDPGYNSYRAIVILRHILFHEKREVDIPEKEGPDRRSRRKNLDPEELPQRKTKEKRENSNEKLPGYENESKDIRIHSDPDYISF